MSTTLVKPTVEPTVEYVSPAGRSFAAAEQRYRSPPSATNGARKFKTIRELFVSCAESIDGLLHQAELYSEAKYRAVIALDDRTLKDIGLLRAHVMVSGVTRDNTTQ